MSWMPLKPMRAALRATTDPMDRMMKLGRLNCSEKKVFRTRTMTTTTRTVSCEKVKVWLAGWPSSALLLCHAMTAKREMTLGMACFFVISHRLHLCRCHVVEAEGRLFACPAKYSAGDFAHELPYVFRQGEVEYPTHVV